MAIEPVKIPQNVYIEDRIVGPLTLRQILMVSVGGGFSYALWSTLQKTYGGVSIPVTVLAWLPALVAALFAFVEVNGLSLMRLILLLMERMSKAPKRTWTPRQGITINIRTLSSAEEQKAKIAPAVEKQTGGIEQLTNVLDAWTTTPETPESEEISLTQTPETPASEQKQENVVAKAPEREMRDIFPPARS